MPTSSMSNNRLALGGTFPLPAAPYPAAESNLKVDLSPSDIICTARIHPGTTALAGGVSEAPSLLPPPPPPMVVLVLVVVFGSVKT